MTPIDSKTPILGLNTIVHFLYLCFKQFPSLIMSFYKNFCMEFLKLIASILKLQLKSFSFLQIISYIEITIEFLQDLSIFLTPWLRNNDVINHVLNTHFLSKKMKVAYS